MQIGSALRPARLLPPAGPLRRYALVSLLDAIGTGLFLSASALFFVHVVGLTGGQVATGLTASGIAGILSAVPLGRLGDRWGPSTVWLVLTCCQAALFLIYPFVSNALTFTVVVVAIGLVDGGVWPVRAAYLAEIAGADRVKQQAYNRVMFNVGFSMGVFVAAVGIAVGTATALRSTVIANALSFVLAALIIRTLPGSGQLVTDLPKRRRRLLLDYPFLATSFVNGFLFMHGALLTVALPLWLVQRSQVPRIFIALNLFINCVLAVALQVAASKGADDGPSAARLGRRAGFVLLLACLVLSLTGRVGAGVGAMLTVLGVVLLTVGELWQSASSWGLSYALTPEARRSEYLGLFSIGTGTGEALAPAIVVGLVLGAGRLGWYLLGAIFFLLGMLLVPLTNLTERSSALRDGSHASQV